MVHRLVDAAQGADGGPELLFGRVEQGVDLAVVFVHAGDLEGGHFGVRVMSGWYCSSCATKLRSVWISLKTWR